MNNKYPVIIFEKNNKYPVIIFVIFLFRFILNWQFYHHLKKHFSKHKFT